MRTKKFLIVAIACVVAIALVAAVGASAGDEPGDNPGNQLAGAWLVAIDRPAPLSDLLSLQTLTRDGNYVEDSNGGATVRSTSHGAWTHLQGRLYASTMIFFRFDPATGAYIGTQKVNRTLRLSQDGDSFTGIGVSELRDPAGNLVATLRAPEVGTRIEVEAIADQP
jgi:hypothetical protein